PDAAPYGPSQTLAGGEERSVELAVPGGDWAVTVNGGELLGSLDAGSRRGRLPVTLILENGGPLGRRHRTGRASIAEHGATIDARATTRPTHAPGGSVLTATPAAGPPSALDDDGLAEVRRIGSADLMVGIPSFGNAETIGYVV